VFLLGDLNRHEGRIMHVLSLAMRFGVLASAIGIAMAAGILIGGLVVKHVVAAEPMPIETPVDQMPDQMERAYIIGLQEELQAHGYKPGPVDGVLGARTKQAIRQYQKDAGLQVNGVASKELLDHMKFALPKVNAKPGSAEPSRALVSEVQQLLWDRGYYRDAVDGLMGPATRDAVKRFQADAKLPVTGVVDQRLKGELASASAEIRASTF
jgi:peptidoglycan hydrolase-like protein with peptidoglycan-binding domain